jgi:hypothetical protein
LSGTYVTCIQQSADGNKSHHHVVTTIVKKTTIWLIQAMQTRFKSLVSKYDNNRTSPELLTCLELTLHVFKVLTETSHIIARRHHYCQKNDNPAHSSYADKIQIIG